MSFAVLLSLVVLSVLNAVTSLPTTHKSVAAAWYTGWHATGPNAFPLSKVSWDKLLHHISLDGSDPSLLNDFVTQAHEHNVAAHVGIGSWGGSVYFSSNLATAEKRTAFVAAVVKFAVAHGLNGIEFDWEYPNKQGIGRNTISDADTSNFLLFLQELRANVRNTLTLTAAVSINPFNDASGKPSTDMSGFTQVLDYIVIMDYDVWGPWSSRVGPNSPLDDTCATSNHQAGSAVSAVKAWTSAGMPIDKIVLGVPSYGHSFSVSPAHAFVPGSEPKELASYPKFDASKQPLGDAWGDSISVDPNGVKRGPSGTFELWGLVDGGFLTQQGKLADGIYYRYDECSQTPYVYNEMSKVMVSFDNADSFTAKGKYIKKTGLRGFSMWEAGGDFNNILLDSIRSAAGFP